MDCFSHLDHCFSEDMVQELKEMRLENFEEFFSDDLNINYIKRNNWLIDNVDELITNDKELNSKKILNLINIIIELKDNIENSRINSYAKMYKKCAACRP